MATKAVTAPAEMNVWRKLLVARQAFLDAHVKKTGKNTHLEFKYFELKDIVPVITPIATELGLIFLPTFTDEEATLTVLNVDKPEEEIIFRSPMRTIESAISKTGGKITNEIQNLGSVETYQRRYLYMMALDIVEDDTIDADSEEAAPEPKPVQRKKPAAPPTPAERKEVVKQLTDAEGPADELQIEAVINSLGALIDLDPDKESFVQEIVLKTNKFKELTKSAAAELIKELQVLIDSYQQVSKTENTEG